MPKTNRKRSRTTTKAADGGRKDEDVRFRVSAEEKEALQRAAVESGLKLSQWLRQLALRTAGALPGAN